MNTLPILEILRSLPYNFFILDIDAPGFTILEGSERHIKGMTRRREDITGKHIFDVFPRQDDYGEDKLLQSFLKVLSTRQSDKIMMQYDLAGEGTDKYEFRYWKILNLPFMQDGEVRYIINCPEDVTPIFKIL